MSDPRKSNFWKNIHPLLKREKDKDYTGKPKDNDFNYGILNTLATILSEAEQETIDSKKQSSLKSATDDYLDEWGDWFGVYRREGESDTDLRERITFKIDVPRGTPDSISMAVKSYYTMNNDDLKYDDIVVYVKEPWRKILIASPMDYPTELNPKAPKPEVSKLSSDSYLIGEYYNVGVIDVIINQEETQGLRKHLEDFKPAGVTMHFTFDPSFTMENIYNDPIHRL